MDMLLCITNRAGDKTTMDSTTSYSGFAYDGNPIYGAFGFSDALDSTSI